MLTHSRRLILQTSTLWSPFPRVSTRSIWSTMPMGPPDPILGLTDAFLKNTSPNKVSLGVGAYREDDGNPHVLETVRRAERLVVEKNLNHEYAGITGVPGFIKQALEFGYGKGAKEIQIIIVWKALSGTGACRVFGELMGKFMKKGNYEGKLPSIYVPNPTWGNHIPIFSNSGLEVRKYKYYNPSTCGFDFEGMVGDIMKAPNGSLFLLHACAHNPTGVDPSKEQWKQLSQAMKEKQHVVFFDSAYQGFASGDPEEDAFSIRHFVEDGHQIALAQSFAKNFGLYGERIGALSVVCTDEEEAQRVESQLKIIIRPMYSNPPVHGARIVEQILSDPEMEVAWGRLEELGSKRNWAHITNQIGMFCFTGLTEEEVLKIRAERHVYFTADGRISMAGLTSANVNYVGDSIYQVTG